MPSLPCSTVIRKAIATDDRDDVDGARRAAYSGGYYAAKFPPPIESLTWRVLQDSSSSAKAKKWKVNKAATLFGTG